MAYKTEAVAAKPAKNEKREIENISIEKAENGFIVRCRYKPKQQKRGGMMEPMYEPAAEHVFEDAKSMAAFVESEFPQMTAEEDDEEEE